ncbi:DUF2336 domain-containing protein [Microvirga massiliensis]|uniref:DUF2336 domain-containing protein n=1 Tax=Microvirga massiliensis TaxID=1033741 RepID=UPI000660195A|nr:DUF2336 domain-containing protein [Microvirga massiliensis]
MSTSAHTTLWEMPLGAREPAALRSALLRAQAELFVGAPARDREVQRSFEALALGLLQRVDRDTAQAVLHTLAACSDTPETVVDYLIQALPGERSWVARTAPKLSNAGVALLMSSSVDRAALAERTDLSEAVYEQLAILAEPQVDLALAANAAIDPESPAFRHLLGRARADDRLAAAILRRDDLTPVDEAALYLAADGARQTEIRTRLASSALFERSRTLPRPEPTAIEALVLAAVEGAMDTVEAELARACRFAYPAPWRFLEPGRGDLLPLGLRAGGFDEDCATRVFLTIHPAISHSVPLVFGMVRTFRSVARPIALALVEAILNLTADIERRGQHQPLFDPSGVPERAGALDTARRLENPAAERRVAR